MVSAHPYPQTLEERLVFYGLAGTWALYVTGALYAAAPVLGWVLMVWLAFKWLVQSPQTPAEQLAFIPVGAWVWIIAMLVMQVALVAGHLSFDLGVGATIKSSIGWAKGWALMAIFIVAGAALQIRPAVVYRAACLVGLQTLLLVPLFIAAPFLHMPEVLYTSPLKAIGGPGPEFFQVELYSRNAGSEALRWRFFAPWAPAAGFASIILLVLSFRDRNWRWRLIGCLAAVVMCLMCQSRLALLAMIVVSVITYALSRVRQPSMAWLAAVAFTIGGMAASALLDAFEVLDNQFTQARADSSRVRAALARIALHRWQSEAPIWGHGVVEPGPHLVEYMPIGSHHSWFGLLFVKGAVGFCAFAVPMVWTTVEMLIRAQSSSTGRTGLAIMLTLWLFTFGENLEIQVYMYWPGLVIIGVVMREACLSPRS